MSNNALKMEDPWKLQLGKPRIYVDIYSQINPNKSIGDTNKKLER